MTARPVAEAGLGTLRDLAGRSQTIVALIALLVL